MSNETILFVDDEQNVLDSFRRQLRKRFTVKIANGGEEALQLLRAEGPFAVIVSDMRMPGMDGVQLLTRTKELYPDMVRLMLTGNVDQETAAQAVNAGHVFRFLTKPCTTATLVTSLALALRQHRLISAEHELLNETLKGSITVLTELLSISNPAAFSSAYRIKDTVVQLASLMDVSNKWQFEIAALLSQVGCVTLPHEILHKLQSGTDLSEEESTTYNNHPQVGKELIVKIPRLEKVAGMIEHQLRNFDDFDSGSEDIPEEVQLGAQILKVAIDYDLLLHQGISHTSASQEMSDQSGVYNKDILRLISSVEIQEERVTIFKVQASDLTAGMIAEEDILAKNGTLIIPKGQNITWSTIQGLRNFLRHIGLQEPIKVRVIDSDEEQQEVV